MDLKDWVKDYKKIEAKQPHLTTVIVYNKNVSQFIEELEKQIKNTGKMSNQFLGKLIRDKYIKLKKFIETNSILFRDDLVLSHIFLSGNLNTIPYYQLSKIELSTLKEYNIPNLIIKQNRYFELNYIIDLFTNFNFSDGIVIDSQHWKHLQLNETKHKILHLEKYQVNTIVEKLTKYTTLDKNIKSKDILYILVSPSKLLSKEITDKTKYEITEVNKYPQLPEILELVNIYQIKQNQKLLSNYLSHLDNPEIENKLIYGNFEEYIYPEIESYRIKELFYHKNHQTLIDKLDSDYLNFRLIEIDTVIKGDIGEQLLENYGGFFGIRYY